MDKEDIVLKISEKLAELLLAINLPKEVLDEMAEKIYDHAFHVESYLA